MFPRGTRDVRPVAGQLGFNSLVPKFGVWEQSAKGDLRKKIVAENVGARVKRGDAHLERIYARIPFLVLAAPMNEARALSACSLSKTP
jgi:hypothetical protein